MNNQNVTYYSVSTKLQNIPGVLARITILLRKFNVNIREIKGHPIDSTEKFHIMDFILETTKDEKSFSTVMKKLCRLIPVIEVKYSRQN